MNKIFQAITNFTAGELSPLLDGRVDIQKYYAGAKTLINMLVHPHGGISRRPGTKYIGAAKYSDRDARLIPFECRTDRAYILEFGDCYMRVFMDQAQVVDSTKIENGTFTDDIDGWDNLSTSPCTIGHLAQDDYITNGTFVTGITEWDDISNPNGHIAWNAASEAIDIGSDLNPQYGWAEQDVQNLTTGIPYTLSFDVLINTDDWVEALVGSATGLDDLSAASVCHVGTHNIDIDANNYATWFVSFRNNDGTITVDNIALEETYYNCLALYANETTSAWAEQDVINLSTQVARTIEFYLNHGTCEILVGSTSGGEDLSAASVCHPGYHSVDVTANNYGTHYIGFKNTDDLVALIDDVSYMGIYYEIATPFGAGHLERLYYTQTADTMYFAHPNYPPQQLIRSADDDWTLEAISFGPALAAPAAATLTVLSGFGVDKTYQYAVTAWAADYGESNPAYTNRASNSMILDQTSNQGVSWDAVEGAEKYFLYRYESAINGFGLVGVATQNNLYIKDQGEVDLNLDEWLPYAQNPFTSIDNYPAVVGLYEQRGIWGGTNTDINKFWASRSGNPIDLTTGIVDDDGFALRIAGDMNRIRWIASLKTLLFGTAGGEGRIASDSINAPLTTTNAFIRRETNFGAEPFMPILIGNAVLFIQRLGRKIRRFVYEADLESWGSADMMILSEHLTSTVNAGTITELAYMKEPLPIVWAKRSDGIMLGLTYDQVQDVFGWHRHKIGTSLQSLASDDEFKSVAVIPGSDRSETWFLIKRTVLGSEVRYIELLQSTEFENMEDYWGLDSALQYSGAAATRITGMAHLAGATVSALANGIVINDLEVSDGFGVEAAGVVYLDNAATLVTIGVPYTATWQSMRQEFATRAGSSQGKMKRIISAMVRVFRSAGFKIGTTAQTNQDYPVDVIMDEVSFDLENDGRPEGDVGDPTGDTQALWTCDKEVVPEGGFNRDGYIWIQQDDPLPLHILGVFARMSTGDM